MFQELCRRCVLFGVALSVGFVGCQSQHDSSEATMEVERSDAHSPGPSSQEGAADFDAVLKSVEAMTNKICKAFADGTPDDAHDTLHDVGHSLETLPSLAAKEGKFTQEQLANAKEAVDALFDGFGKLDDTMHGGEEVDVKEVEGKLKDALRKLKETVK